MLAYTYRLYSQTIFANVIVKYFPSGFKMTSVQTFVNLQKREKNKKKTNNL